MANLARRMWAPIDEWLESTTKVKYVVPAYLILGLGCFLGWARLDDLNEARIADQAKLAAADVRAACVSRAETFQAIRSVLIALVTSSPTSDSEQTDLIISLIDQAVPEADLAEVCGPNPAD